MKLPSGIKLVSIYSAVIAHNMEIFQSILHKNYKYYLKIVIFKDEINYCNSIMNYCSTVNEFFKFDISIHPKTNE